MIRTWVDIEAPLICEESFSFFFTLPYIYWIFDRFRESCRHVCAVPYATARLQYLLKLPTFEYSPETTHSRMEIDSFVLSICLHFSTRLGLLRKVLIHRVYVSSKGRFKITRWLVFGGGGGYNYDGVYGKLPFF